MPDILYAAALDKQLYADSQLAVAQAQRSAADTRKANCASLVQACATCLACCECCVTVVKTPTAKVTEICIQQCLDRCPMSCCAWALIPDKCGQSGWCTFAFGGNTETYVMCGSYRGRCGASCNWTVPSGVCCVQFDFWSPGAQSGSGYCCGHATWGANGSFGSITMPVTEGHTYCLCAGCGVCCQVGPSYNDKGFRGGCTSIIGCNLCNVCIVAPTPHALKYFNWDKGMPTWCRSFNCGGGSGQCFCGGIWQCADNSCATCGVICAGPNDSMPLGRTIAPNSHYFKVRGSGGGCYCKDTNNYGWYRSIGVPRWPGDANTSSAPHNGFHCKYATSNTCNGCQWGGEYCMTCTPCIPGMGGAPTHIMGSCTNAYGSYVRGGAVRVVFKCPV